MKFDFIKNVASAAIKKTVQSGPAILASSAAIGLVVTGILAYKAGVKSKDIIKEHEEEMSLVKKGDKKAENAVYKETAKKLAPIVTPPILLGATSIACMFGSLHVSLRRTAALSAAFSLSENAVKDMEKKMADVLGVKKTKELKESIMKDKLQADTVPSSDKIILTGNGDVLCKDFYSGRYFMSSPEKINQAIAWASSEARAAMYVSLNEFYDQLNVDRIPLGDQLGWNVDDLDAGTLPITTTAILTEDGRPCICIDILASVREDFSRLH